MPALIEHQYKKNSNQFQLETQQQFKETVEQQLVNVKTKNQPKFTFLKWKVDPKKFELDIPVNRSNKDFVGNERQILQQAADDYFAADNPGVRCYKKSEKEFVWVKDVWPYYRQTLEHNYSGPAISQAEHFEYVKVHLYQEWI